MSEQPAILQTEKTETPVEVKTETPVEEKKVEVPKKPKRKNVKRKHLFEEKEEKVEVREKVEETDEEEPSTKRVRITKSDDETPIEEPSFFRGGFVKPLLLGLLASGSFYVNHLYKTTNPVVPPPPVQPVPKKNTTKTPPISKPTGSNLLFKTTVPTRSCVVKGFRM